MISVISLEKLLKVLSDEEKVLSGVLCSFSCKKNSEVEKFIKEDAIDFNKKGLARTYLIVSSCNGNNIILGYFTLAMKAFIIEDMQELDDELSKTQIKKVMRFVSRYNCEVNGVNAGFSVIPQMVKKMCPVRNLSYIRNSRTNKGHACQVLHATSAV